MTVGGRRSVCRRLRSAPGRPAGLRPDGHSRGIDILDYARKSVRPGAPVHARLGGLHLFAAKEDTLEGTAGKLKEFGVTQMMGEHCTGIQPGYYFRERLGLDRKACVVGAVGTAFELGKGISPGLLAQ